jgi:hypothetical protein
MFQTTSTAIIALTTALALFSAPTLSAAITYADDLVLGPAAANAPGAITDPWLRPLGSGVTLGDGLDILTLSGMVRLWDKKLTFSPDNNDFETFRSEGRRKNGPFTTGWYRIAEITSTAQKSSVEVTLRDNSWSAYHSSCTFRMGVSYSDTYKNASFTLLSNHYWFKQCFTSIRLQKKTGGIHDPMYLEVYIDQSNGQYINNVESIFQDNTNLPGWTLTSWTPAADALTTGYEASYFNLADIKFSVGGSGDLFSVQKDGSTVTTGSTTVYGGAYTYGNASVGGNLTVTGTISATVPARGGISMGPYTAQ